MRKILFILLIGNSAFGQVNKPHHVPPIIINDYAQVLNYNICTNAITVDDATAYKIGDTVLLIQMKGAVIDTSNTSAFGTVLDYKNAGNYEFNYISQKSGNILKFKNYLTRSYDIANGAVQLVRVPYYDTAFFIGGLTCMAWDGTKGGILAIITTHGLDVNDFIDVSGLGFRPGEGYNSTLPSPNCFENNYNDFATNQLAAFKGESIVSLSQNTIKGKGSPASGGGGGLSHNSGGGGGANVGAGGFGGYQSDTCGSAPFDNRGIGGKGLAYSATASKIFMGGGGGAGHADNTDPTVKPPSGGAGGGIIIILTDTLYMHSYEIFANGGSAERCYSPDCNDGMGGGGGGGTVLLSANKIDDVLGILTSGGDGAHVLAPTTPGGKVGPGGGGGGGAFFLNASSMPLNITVQNNGGANGIIAASGGNAWGATPGSSGANYFNLVLPFDNVLFVPNIDSVRIKDSVVYCNNVDLKGFGYTNSYPVSSWQWDFGDGATANTQNTSHNYGSIGAYPVKLIVTDINGCKDSITKSVQTFGPMLAEAGLDTSFCASGPVSVRLNGSGTGNYSWSPAAYLNNPNISNPIATISSTTKFYLTMTNGTGCSAVDSVTVTINANPAVRTLKDTSICKGSTLILTTTGASSYAWSPGASVSDSSIASPRFIDTVSRVLIVTGTGANGCSAKDTILVNVKTAKIFLAPLDKSFCFGKSVQLDGRNGNNVQYLWSPSTYLSNPNIVDPIADPPFSTIYSVKVTDNVCNYDSSFSVLVTVYPLPALVASSSNDINCYLPYSKLNASGALGYLWTPAATLSSNSIHNPIANPTVTTTYFVTGINNNGCVAKDSVTVVIDFSFGVISLPNSFTPNGDRVNDCFGIKYHRDVKDLIFIIYNRYGAKVFETKNADECWNGYHKGQPADAGNYVYYLSAKTLCGDLIKKGNILLIR